MNSTTAERRWWLLTALYSLAIFVGAYFVQFLLDDLRRRGWLEVTLGLGFGVVAVVLLAAIARRRPRPREWLVVPVALVVYGWLWTRFDVIQERVHLVQYGLLAALILAALEARKRRVGTGRPFLVSLLSTALVGWADEGIQAILPNRTYDLRDVGLNALSGGLFLALVALHRWLHRGPDRVERTVGDGSAIE